MSGKSNPQGGFTIFEAVFTVALFGIVSNIAIDSSKELVSSFNRSDSMSILKDSLLLSQQKTIASGCRGIVSFTESGTAISYGTDCKPYNLSESPLADEIVYTTKLPKNIHASSDKPVIFDSNGRVVSVDGILTNPQISLFSDIPEQNVQFATGSLTSSGIIKYEN